MYGSDFVYVGVGVTTPQSKLAQKNIAQLTGAWISQLKVILMRNLLRNFLRI